MTNVDEKLINSQSKKEMENFICTNLGIITWETVFQKALRTVPPPPPANTAIRQRDICQRIIHQSNMLTVYTVQQGE